MTSQASSNPGGQHTLLLRLEGLRQAWGTQSRFSIRDTESEPSKSGVLGLVGAALGKPRRECLGDGLPTLAELRGLRFGVRVDREGVRHSEFQTIGMGHFPGVEPGKYRIYRADDGGLAKFGMLSTRWHLEDASFLVGLEGDLVLLRRIESALRNPVFPLYLGRKHCIPSRRILVKNGLVARSLEDALLLHKWPPAANERGREERQGRVRKPASEVRLALDVDPDEDDWVSLRYDIPLDVATRRFAPRSVQTRVITYEEHLGHCKRMGGDSAA